MTTLEKLLSEMPVREWKIVDFFDDEDGRVQIIELSEDKTIHSTIGDGECVPCYCERCLPRTPVIDRASFDRLKSALMKAIEQRDMLHLTLLLRTGLVESPTSVDQNVVLEAILNGTDRAQGD